MCLDKFLPPCLNVSDMSSGPLRCFNMSRRGDRPTPSLTYESALLAPSPRARDSSRCPVAVHTKSLKMMLSVLAVPGQDGCSGSQPHRRRARGTNHKVLKIHSKSWELSRSHRDFMQAKVQELESQKGDSDSKLEARSMPLTLVVVGRIRSCL